MSLPAAHSEVCKQREWFGGRVRDEAEGDGTCSFGLCPNSHVGRESNTGHQQLYWSHPRKFGQGSRPCRVCSNRHGLIQKYGLNMCCQYFRQYVKDISFIKLD
ncbi:unnamed protein product [Rangifer tarandus platyrhynchus]